MTENNLDKDKYVVEHNGVVWDGYAQANGAWSRPVSHEIIEQAKQGHWNVHITKKALDDDWLPKDISGKKILCLASAGGQQAPVLSAAGADVTVYDISKGQLDKDDFIAQRDELTLKTIQGDMRDLSVFSDNTFDFILSPISNLYIPALESLWRECYRVLKQGGVLLTSFYNPVLFIFDKDTPTIEKGLLKPKYVLPYSDVSSLEEKDYKEKRLNGEALVFGHTLTQQIGQQIEAGFVVSGFYEDDHPSPRFLIEQYMQTMIAVRSVKL